MSGVGIWARLVLVIPNLKFTKKVLKLLGSKILELIRVLRNIERLKRKAVNEAEEGDYQEEQSRELAKRNQAVLAKPQKGAETGGRREMRAKDLKAKEGFLLWKESLGYSKGNAILKNEDITLEERLERFRAVALAELRVKGYDNGIVNSEKLFSVLESVAKGLNMKEAFKESGIKPNTYEYRWSIQELTTHLDGLLRQAELIAAARAPDDSNSSSPLSQSKDKNSIMSKSLSTDALSSSLPPRMGAEGNDLFSVVEGDNIAGEYVFSSQEIDPYPQFGGKAYRHGKGKISQFNGQAVIIDPNAVAVANRQQSGFSRFPFDSQGFGFLIGEQRNHGPGIDIDIKDNAIYFDGNNRGGRPSVGFIGEFDYTRLRTHRVLNSSERGTRKNSGVHSGYFLLAFLTMALGDPSLSVKTRP